MENTRIFDLILQNSASKKEWIIRGLVDTSETTLYHQFDDFKMPEDAPFGEYYCALLWNTREDVEYEIKDNLLDTICHTAEGDITLRDLRAETDLFQYGDAKEKNQYRNKNTDFIYRKK